MRDALDAMPVAPRSWRICRLLSLLGLSALLLVGCKKKDKEEAEGGDDSSGGMEQAGGPGMEGGGMSEAEMFGEQGGGEMAGGPGMAGEGGMMGEPGRMGGPGMAGDPGMMGEPGMAGGPGMAGDPGMAGGPGMAGEGGMMGEPGMMGGGIAGAHVCRGPLGYILVSIKQDGTIDAGLVKGRYQMGQGNMLAVRLFSKQTIRGTMQRSPTGFRVAAQGGQGIPLSLDFVRVAPFQSIQQLNGNWNLDTAVAFGPDMEPEVKGGQRQPGTIKDGTVYWGIKPDSTNGKPFAVAPSGGGRFTRPASDKSPAKRCAIYLGGNLMVLRHMKDDQGVVRYFVFVKRAG